MGAKDRRADFRRLVRAALAAEEHYERFYARGRVLPSGLSGEVIQAFRNVMGVLDQEHKTTLRQTDWAWR